MLANSKSLPMEDLPVRYCSHVLVLESHYVKTKMGIYIELNFYRQDDVSPAENSHCLWWPLTSSGPFTETRNILEAQPKKLQSLKQPKSFLRP